MHAPSSQVNSRFTDQVETEWQFDAADLRAIETWLLAHTPEVAPPGQPSGVAPENDASAPRIEISAGPSKTLADSYFDTEDWGFYRAGYALRLRHSGQQAEVTLKSLAEGKDEFRSRREITQIFAQESVQELHGIAEPVGGFIRALTGHHPLRRLVSIDTRRQTFMLTISGIEAGEIALDETTIPLDKVGESVRLRRVEVEVHADYLGALGGWADALRIVHGLQPAMRSKYETALLAHGLVPPEPSDFGSTAINARLSLGEVAFAVLRRQFTVLLAREPGCRLGIDSEELHKMRVATRRMRAALSLFAAALPVRAGRIREELRWLAQALGEVRDYDVQIEQVEAWIAASVPFERAAFEAFRETLRAGRAAARRRMLRVLDSRRFERLSTACAALLRRGPLRRSAAASALIIPAATELIRARYRKVRNCAATLSEDSAAEEYHRLRILCKRLRYAIEFVAELYDEPARDFVARVSALQDLLGLHQDAYVAIAQLRDFGVRPGRNAPPQTPFVMGQTAQRAAQQAHELRLKFPKAYRRLKGKSWKRLRHALRQTPDPTPSQQEPADAEQEV